MRNVFFFFNNIFISVFFSNLFLVRYFIICFRVWIFIFSISNYDVYFCMFFMKIIEIKYLV